MDISDIYVHDGKLQRVVEETELAKITMTVLLPADPMSSKLIPRLLIFEEVYGYQIFEGNIDGCPTILNLSVVEQSGRWSRVRMDTNHGYRELYCTAVRLRRPYDEVRERSNIRAKRTREHLATLTAKALKLLRPDIAAPDVDNILVSADRFGDIVMFPIGPERMAKLTFDWEQDEVVGFSAFKGFSVKQYPEGLTKVTDDVFLNKIQIIHRNLGIDANTITLVSSHPYKISDLSKQEQMRYVWHRRINGFPYKDDYLIMTFDALDGELLGVHKQWSMNLPFSPL